MSSTPPTAAERRNDIDWLRIGATYLLFAFHIGKIFDVMPFYHLKNADLSEGMGYFTGFVHQWHMRLFFLLAGWSLFSSLAARGRRTFLAERTWRILVPFAAGCLLFAPFMRYAEVLNETFFTRDGAADAGAFAGAGFFEFLPHFFTLEAFSWAHLWFLIYLYVFTRLYLPLFQWLIQRSGEPRQWSAAWVYAPILPLALIQVTMRDRWPGIQNLYDDWANFLFYSLFFITGFLFARYPAIERAAHREWRRAGLLGLGACLAMTLPWGAVLERPELATRALSGAAAWGCVLGLLGFAKEHLTAGGAALRYLRESSLPVYILHSPAIVLVGYWVIQLDAGISEKFALILTGSVGLTLVVYHFAVRRFGPLRLLFGMRAGVPSAWVLR
ncbi:acyltransferase family protein [bacterium]|nr:acyltransferase family protein [bacterium]